MSQIELYSKLQEQNPIQAIQTMGAMMAKSGMFGCQRAEQGEVLAMICMTENMTPIQVRKKYDIIDGNLSRKTGSALAEFKKIGGKYKWLKTGQEPEQTDADRYAECWFELDGQEITVRYSMKEAERAGLIRPNSQWVKAPWLMLRKRVASNALGMIAPEIYFGDDDDDTTPEPRTIKLGSEDIKTDAPAPTPKDIPIETKPETVFEAEVVTEEAQPEPSPAPKQEAPAPSDGELPDDLLKELQTALGADGKVAMKFLYSKGWLEKGQGLECLAPGRAKNIIRNTPAFIAKAKEVAA